jgi:hypothetical protein
MLRKKKKEQGNYYRLRAGNVIAAAGIVISIWLLSAAKLVELRNAAIFLSTGVIVYFLHRKFRKKAASREPACPAGRL